MLTFPMVVTEALDFTHNEPFGGWSLVGEGLVRKGIERRGVVQFQISNTSPLYMIRPRIRRTLSK